MKFNLEFLTSLSDALIKAGTFAIILIITYFMAKAVKNFFARLEKAKPLEFELAHYKFLRHLIVGIIYFLGIVMAISTIPPLKSVAFSLLASSGIAVAVIGFASQQAFSNIISGVFLEIFNPFRIGDRISVKGIIGTVEDVTLRHTVIKTLENKRVIIPNSTMNREIVENISRAAGKIQTNIDIYVTYESNLDKAMKIIREVLEAHPDYLDIRTKHQKEAGHSVATVKVFKLTTSGVNLRGWIWAKNATAAFNLSCDAYKEIKQRFAKEGILFAQCLAKLPTS